MVAGSLCDAKIQVIVRILTNQDRESDAHSLAEDIPKPGHLRRAIGWEA